MLNSTLDHANPDVSPAIHSMGDAYPDFGAEILMIVTLSETGERFFRLSGGRIVHEDGRDVSVTERPEVIATFKPNAVRYREGSNSAVDAALAKLRQGQLLSEDDAVGLGLHRRIA